MVIADVWPEEIRQRRTTMNEDRVVGTARNLGGKAQEGLGRVTGDVKMQAPRRL
jgi:hypothetical protein